MKIKYGADVFNAAGEKVGEVEHVVIDPSNNEITHLVVRKGFLLTEDRVIPITLMARSDEDSVHLREFDGDFDQFPLYIQKEFHQVGELEAEIEYTPGYTRPLYPYPPLDVESRAFSPDFQQPVAVTEEKYIEDSKVALKDGADVFSLDGSHVGDVEQVFSDPRTDRITHLLISKGMLLKENKLVPVSWVDQYNEQSVHLLVGNKILENLPEYKN